VPIATNATPTPHDFAVISSQVTTNQVSFLRLHLNHFLVLTVMGDQSGSSHFHELFESAFQSYETNTGISLLKPPLAERLQSCHSVEDITALVQDQASTVSELGGNDRIMKSIKSTVSILATLSATASLGDTIGLVSQKGADSVFHISDRFYSHSTP
jgi:hypothetical protein